MTSFHPKLFETDQTIKILGVEYVVADPEDFARSVEGVLLNPTSYEIIVQEFRNENDTRPIVLSLKMGQPVEYYSWLDSLQKISDMACRSSRDWYIVGSGLGLEKVESLLKDFDPKKTEDVEYLVCQQTLLQFFLHLNHKKYYQEYTCPYRMEALHTLALQTVRSVSNSEFNPPEEVTTKYLWYMLHKLKPAVFQFMNDGVADSFYAGMFGIILAFNNHVSYVKPVREDIRKYYKPIKH